MTIHGMNKKTCKGLFVVYVTVNRNKYFVGAYRTMQQAQAAAELFDGKYFFNS